MANDLAPNDWEGPAGGSAAMRVCGSDWLEIESLASLTVVDRNDFNADMPATKGAMMITSHPTSEGCAESAGT